MHAGFPIFTKEIQQVLSIAINNNNVSGYIDFIGGKLVAKGMASLLELGFAAVLHDGLLDITPKITGREFVEDNFIITDPLRPEKKIYYQGKFLFRTDKPGDDMNVLLKFCPDPQKLDRVWKSGGELKADMVVHAEDLSEEEAQRLEDDPTQVDLVIAFKDVSAVLGLLKRPEVDVPQLLLENLVHVRGSTGHFFKFGAIARDVTLAFGLG